MKLRVQKSDEFLIDYALIFRWYVAEAGVETAWRFEAALDATLEEIALQPQLGRQRSFKHPRLQGMRSFRVDEPFGRLLIFYRVNGEQVAAVRLMHGARDLGRRLAELPDMG